MYSGVGASRTRGSRASSVALLRQGERYIRVPGLRSQLTATRRQDDKLPAAHGKRARWGIAGRRQRGFPAQPAGVLVERAKLRILSRRDEHETTLGDDRTTVLLGPGDGHATRGQPTELAERNAPAVVAGVEIDGAECAPGRFDRGIAIRIAPTFVAGEFIGQSRGGRGPPAYRIGWANRVAKKFDDGRLLTDRQARERRHPASAAVDNQPCLPGGQSVGDANDCRRSSVTPPIRAVTPGTCGGVYRSTRPGNSGF